MERVRGLRSPYPTGLRRRDYASVRRQPPFTIGTTTFLGNPLGYSDNVGLLHSVREVFSDEVYRFTAKRDNPRIVDAGANIGLSVLYFKNLYPTSEIVAYEPDPDVFALLAKNVGRLDGVHLRQQAAWIEDTSLTFFKEGSLAGSSEVDFLGAGNSVEVKASRLRDELQKGPIDFLKIDIEGAENSVIFDIEDTLDHVDHFFFEYHSSVDKPQMLGDLLALVTRAGYRFAINGTHSTRFPFVERVERGFDLQANVFCFRP